MFHTRTSTLLPWIPCILITFGWAGTLESVTFPTSSPPPPCRIPEPFARYERPFRATLNTLPEGAVLVSGLNMAGAELKLTLKERNRLSTLITRTYTRIFRDPDFKDVSSALPYCFSSTRPREGHYFLYRPETLAEQSTCIVFLHGEGGNFLLYPWLLKQEFPDAVLLFPSWSISWENGSSIYLKEMIRHAEQRLGKPLQDPWLMGISAGARGGFSLFTDMKNKFGGYISLGSAPPSADAQQLTPRMRILMLNAVEDQIMPLEIARRQATWVKHHIPGFEYEEVDGDHFFPLTHRTQTFGTVRSFMDRAAKNP